MRSLHAQSRAIGIAPVAYPHLRDHETKAKLVCRILLEKKKEEKKKKTTSGNDIKSKKQTKMNITKKDKKHMKYNIKTT